jgi:hypothetical protein
LQTIGFLKDYDSIRLLPLTHRNTAVFYGMTAKEDYLIWRHEQGTFTALSKKESRLSMWSTVTGKVLNTVTASGEAFQSNNNKKST